MKEETGHAVLKVNEEGRKYWEVWTQDSKDAVAFDIGKPLGFNPKAFNEGAVIKVFEDET